VRRMVPAEGVEPPT